MSASISPAAPLNSPVSRRTLATSPSYRVGRDGEGHWVAVEEKGLAGGIFRSLQDAVHFACVETGCRPKDVTVETGPIRFRM